MYTDEMYLLRDETLKTKCVLMGIRVEWVWVRSSYVAYISVDRGRDHIGIVDRDPHRAAEMLLDVLSNPYGS